MQSRYPRLSSRRGIWTAHTVPLLRLFDSSSYRFIPVLFRVSTGIARPASLVQLMCGVKLAFLVDVLSRPRTRLTLSCYYTVVLDLCNPRLDAFLILSPLSVTLGSPLLTQVRHVAPNTHDSYDRRSRKHGYIPPGKYSRCEYCLAFVFLCTWQLCHVGSRGEVASSAGDMLALLLRSDRPMFPRSQQGVA